jgi:sulfatase maturation enzyme AslB (radical SAM superfamily)
MLEKFGKRTNLSGPQRLDLMFDNSCNLACRSCGADRSTFWQKHLKENNIADSFSPVSRVDDMIDILHHMNLSNLEMVVFCGGETLLGQNHWKVAEAIAKLAPNAREKIILSFQTNGTHAINERNIETIKKFHLVKLNISLDATNQKFNYLRWPADWGQVTKNILDLQKSLPYNTMFLIEETISVLNLYYQKELESWIQNNFSTNRLGDITNHTKHLAQGLMSLDAVTKEYVEALKNTNLVNFISPTWQENPSKINALIKNLDKFDAIRNENWRTTFPEVAEFYKRFDTSGM